MRLSNKQLSLPIEPSPAEQPDIREWGLILLNSSGGKNSQTMIDEVVRLADENGVSRDRLVVVHADLGRVEWPGVKELAKEQADHYGLEFEWEKRKIDLLGHVDIRIIPHSTS